MSENDVALDVIGRTRLLHPLGFQGLDSQKCPLQNAKRCLGNFDSITEMTLGVHYFDANGSLTGFVVSID
jgi:hypothetical protein